MKSLSIRAQRRQLCAALALLSASLGAFGAESERREHGAHEHGHGSLDVVTEGRELVIELRVPGVNVVGFEHEPRSEEQRRAVEQALGTFREGAKLFVPSETARCKIEQVEVSLAGETHHEGEADETHARHERQGPEHNGEAHSELHGEYRFHCAASERLELLEVRVFDFLTGAEALEARVVTPTVQTAAELRPGKTTALKLKR